MTGVAPEQAEPEVGHREGHEPAVGCAQYRPGFRTLVRGTGEEPEGAAAAQHRARLLEAPAVAQPAGPDEALQEVPQRVEQVAGTRACRRGALDMLADPLERERVLPPGQARHVAPPVALRVVEEKAQPLPGRAGRAGAPRARDAVDVRVHPVPANAGRLTPTLPALGGRQPRLPWCSHRVQVPLSNA